MKITLNKKLGLDTNILIYLIDKESSFHFKTVETIAWLEREKVELVVTQQNIVELIQQLTVGYKIPLKIAASKAKQIVDSKIKVVNPLPQTIKTYLKLCKVNVRAKDHFDLFLAATLIDNQISQILTNDEKGFEKVKQLKVDDLTKIPTKLDKDLA